MEQNLNINKVMNILKLPKSCCGNTSNDLYDVARHTLEIEFSRLKWREREFFFCFTFKSLFPLDAEVIVVVVGIVIVAVVTSVVLYFCRGFL